LFQEACGGEGAEEVIKPTAADPPVMPFTAQITDWFELPLTVALNGWLLPNPTATAAGDTDTVTGGGGGGGGGGGAEINVTVAWAEAEAFAAARARMVTVGTAGSIMGAVYTPAESIVPRAEEPPWISFTNQVTAVFAVPVTVATKALLVPNNTLAVVGEIETVIGAAVTLTEMLLPVTAPSPGCRTANLMALSGPATPLARSLVADTNVV
jgi:hypothetical protein